MKLKNIGMIFGCAAWLVSCHSLDLNPLANGSTENWYSDEAEVEMAVNELYRGVFWLQDGGVENGSYIDRDGYDDWSDDMQNRGTLYSFENATLNGQTSEVTNLWTNMYKMIARANGVIENAHRAIANGANETKINNYIAEAHFCRAYAYSQLVFKFGDVPLVTEQISIEQAYEMGRTPKETIMKLIYDDFEAACELPLTTTGKKRATKGAALALKTRVALYMGDYREAAKSAKECIDLNVYQLESDYSHLFYQNTLESSEFIFIIPRSGKFGDYIRDAITRNHFPRNTQGFCAIYPTWDLFAAYNCTDGLPIDESPLFDPKNPFDNRDPRCSMTIVPFGTNHLGVEYNPHPSASRVMNFDTGNLMWNDDNLINHENTTWNGLVWRKGVDRTWFDNGYEIAPPRIIIRYADLLLMYAEAKIELNEIDQSVVDAMNEVRARAYGVDKSDTASYPAFTIQSQDKMRYELRVERRMELAKEGLRYADIIRWRIAGTVMNRKIYGLNITKGQEVTQQMLDDWFWAFTPDIDENGTPDFTALEAAGKIISRAQRRWDDRQYLWPIPTADILINENMKTNPGY